MYEIAFGPSGNSESFYAEGHKNTEEVPAYLKERGLDAFEYSFGRGVTISDEKAASIGKAFEGSGVRFSVHAPYFINFSNPEEEKIANSISYVLRSAAKLRLMGGTRVIFHPASLGKMKREEAFALCLKRIEMLDEAIEAAGFEDVTFCPETMGKHGQIGTTEEIVAMCRISQRFIPCVDFGHVNAFTLGGLKGKDDYRRLLDTLFEGIGQERAKKIHVHFSKIEYAAKGEIRHLTYADTVYGPEFDPLAELFHEYRMTPTVICESAGCQAEDAAILKKIYLK